MRLALLLSFTAVAIARPVVDGEGFVTLNKRATTCSGATFDLPAFSACITNCNTKAGKELFSNYSNDPTSPEFIKSLSYECDSANPERTSFMTKAGICMVACTKEEQDGYTNGYKAFCGWYQEHKSDTCQPKETPSPSVKPEPTVSTPEPAPPAASVPASNNPPPAASSPSPAPQNSTPLSSPSPSVASSANGSSATNVAPSATPSASKSTSANSTASTAPVAPVSCKELGDYKLASPGSCIDDCNLQAGRTFFSDYTKDAKSPNFVKSLAYECDRSHADRISFMSKAGICMAKCSTAEQDSYTNAYKAICGWYSQKLTCTADSTSGSSVISVSKNMALLFALPLIMGL
ncbi:hypothetical protein K7432_010421 [Basidiobolus ranarum]|uniref:Uncharacterized protein n=1 Tax=Basidiobolus ranarum TaxID=34480 RepID=A0ABR2WNQ5_9FUNG